MKPSHHNRALVFAALCLAACRAGNFRPATHSSLGSRSGVRIGVSYAAEPGSRISGRLLLMLSNDNSQEPRFQISDKADTQLIFGQDVDGLAPGEEVVFDASVFGYPLVSLADVPAGEYVVQALLHRYETFHLGNGKTVELPVDQGEGQKWNKSPKNLYSLPRKVRLDPSSGQPLAVVMNQEIPAIAPARDSQYIKHVRIQSPMLTAFWGRPTYLQANVLLPHDFDREPEARYPLMVFHGHFSPTIGGFRTEPPDADPNDGKFDPRFRITGYEYVQQQEAYDFYRKWVSDDFPRFLVLEIQHQNPYYDDSYAVNSANLGPYGDAITYELIPHVERLFRGVGQPWGRFLYGGSTGGWAALAVQIFYPDDYNGAFSACPDPIDFRAYTVVNIYGDKNAYYLESAFKRTPRPAHRDYRGHVDATMEEVNHLELVLGARGRSGGQWDVWQAVYSPMGEDGYPVPIWDKRTGVIDHAVAAHWREHYDLRYILERDWATLGPKLAGKLHIYCGDMDNYYLNNAVVLMEEFLSKTSNPPYGGQVDYGDGFEHCWNGAHDLPNHISRLRYNTLYLPKIRERLRKTAPAKSGIVHWDR